MNARVAFSASPWLLLLIIPVFAAIFALFFTGKKRGSRITLCRVLSAVLQCAAAACCIFALAGICIEYDEPNEPRELVILVDASDTVKGQRGTMDGFVRDLLEENGGRCRTAIVLYGRGQKIALGMGEYDAEEAYAQYLSACRIGPEESATDIASALRLAWDPSGTSSLISDPARARVIVLGDGLETDGDAVAAARSLTRDGIRIETSFYADTYLSDACILGVERPSEALFAEREASFRVTVKSSFAAEGVLSYTDTDASGTEQRGEVPVILKAGTQEVPLKHVFGSAGFHELSFNLETADETKENNVFCCYLEVAESNKLLLLETYPDSSSLLADAIGKEIGDGSLMTETKMLEDVLGLSAEQLSAYSEIVLCNAAQRDMTEGFQRELYRYVNELGGGLFTVGGFERDQAGEIKMEPKYRDPSREVPVRRSYRSADLGDSVFASMLPVTVEEYKPPVAVVFVFDISASMASTSGPLRTALTEAADIINNVLEPRDLAGIVTLQDSYAQTDPLSPMTQKENLLATLEELKDFYDFDAATSYAPALQQATNMLALAPDDVARKHIVFLSDGGPSDKFDVYGPVMAEAGKQGITITVVTYYLSSRVIDGELCYFNHSYDRKGYEINIGNMQKLADYGNGTHMLIPRTSYPGWTEAVKEDMRLDELADIGFDPFVPKVGERSSEVLGGLSDLDLKQLTLGGYFPSRRKLDSSVSVPLLAEGSPLYAQWSLGAGMVGSIMIDLEGIWSEDLFTNDTGTELLGNIVSALLQHPEKAEEPLSFEAVLSERNFRTQVDIYGYEKGQEDAKLVAFVYSPGARGTPQKFDLDALSRTGNRLLFENPVPGVYTVQILKVKASFDFSNSAIAASSDVPDDVLLERTELRRAFSYSKEYDTAADPYAEGQDLLAALSTRKPPSGLSYEKFVYDAETVFEQDGIAHRTEDPRQWLLVAALGLYFAGLCVRRIKFPSRRADRY